LKILSTSKPITFATALILSVSIFISCSAMGSSDDDNGANQSLIAFSARTDRGGIDIYTVRPNGKALVRMTATLHHSVSNKAVWSPDRSLIAFQSSSESLGPSQIYLMNSDGSNITQLTNGYANKAPSWSPDGRFLVFGRQISMGSAKGKSLDKTQIIKYDLEHHSEERIITSDETVSSPVWSPQGDSIMYLYATKYGVGDGLFVIDQNGKNARKIGPYGGEDSFSWSPDGNQIASVVSDDDGRTHLAVMNNDGSDLNIVGGECCGAQSPSWSPDGNTIVFTAKWGDECCWEIFTVRPDGSNLTQITTSDRGDYEPRWSPDSSKLVFKSKGRLWVINVDGEDLRQIVHLQDTQFPSW
jgi:TolB protein